ncbi:hypothetical protein FRC09_013674, partial [Ceratobasidium sp. 395]
RSGPPVAPPPPPAPTDEDPVNQTPAPGRGSATPGPGLASRRGSIYPGNAGSTNGTPAP